MIGQASYPVPDNLFLLNPRHEAFITGKSNNLEGHSFSNRIFTGVIVFMILISALIGVSSIREMYLRQQLEQNGITTSATITHHRISTSTDKDTRRTTNTYYLTYTFRAGSPNDDNPPLYTAEQIVSSTTYNSVVDGEKININYLPDDPNTSRISDDNANNPIIPLAFSIICLIVALYFTRMMWNASKGSRQLIANGQLITGYITEATLRRVQGSNRLTIHYTFTSPKGKEINKRETIIRNDLSRDTVPEPGTPIVVIYADSKLYRVL